MYSFFPRLDPVVLFFLRLFLRHRPTPEHLLVEIKKKDTESPDQKRQSSLMTPISQEINKALQAFAEAEDITMTMDSEKLGESLLTMMLPIDVARAFIGYFNRKIAAR